MKTYPKFGPEYKIEIEIKVRSYGGHPNIFRFAAKEGSSCDIGQRSPALFFMGERMWLSTNIGDNGDKVFHDVLGKYETNKWFKFTIYQKKDEVRIKMN